MRYLNSEIITLIILIVSCIGVVLWVFRPNSAIKYKKYSKIPLQDDEDTNGDKKTQK